MTSDTNGCPDPRIRDEQPDELALRIRSLEAERMRPVPGAPVQQKRPTTAAEVSAARREAHDLHMIEEHLAAVARRAVLEELDVDDEDLDSPQPVPISSTLNGALSRDLCTNSGTTDPQGEGVTVGTPDALSGDDKEAC